MHPERKLPYFSRRRGEEKELGNGNREKKQNYIVTAEMPLPLQYKAFLRNPTKLFLSRSKIHGIGVFTKEELPKGKLVYDYTGQIIRTTLVDKREAQYRKKGLGSYIFAIDAEYAVDATKLGSIARFINHSCSPNCAARVINVGESEKRIVLFAARHIDEGDELSYNYKLPLEDEKIPCVCGAPNCRKFLN